MLSDESLIAIKKRDMIDARKSTQLMHLIISPQARESDRLRQSRRQIWHQSSSVKMPKDVGYVKK